MKRVQKYQAELTDESNEYIQPQSKANETYCHDICVFLRQSLPQ
jgi:hypothetical protein